MKQSSAVPQVFRITCLPPSSRRYNHITTTANRPICT